MSSPAPRPCQSTSVQSGVRGPGVTCAGSSVTQSATPTQSASPVVTRSEAGERSSPRTPCVQRLSQRPGYQHKTPTIPTYEGTPGITFRKTRKEDDRQKLDYESEFDSDTTTDEETEKELLENNKIDTEDEMDLIDIMNDEEPQQAQQRKMLSAGEQTRDNIMGWNDEDFDMQWSVYTYMNRFLTLYFIYYACLFKYEAFVYLTFFNAPLSQWP